MEQVILVDEQDKPTGTMEKMEAHRRGLLHRAFSVFIFNSKGEMLLQQRAGGKYHSGGLWTNACCSHPRPGEDLKIAAKRRLQEEMGIDVPLEHKTSFVYRSEFLNGLTEHEFDHVFTGFYNRDPVPNNEEVQAFRWATIDELKQEIKKKPGDFTTWFCIALEKIF